jgi:hypothetical protein
VAEQQGRAKEDRLAHPSLDLDRVGLKLLLTTDLMLSDLLADRILPVLGFRVEGLEFRV